MSFYGSASSKVLYQPQVNPLSRAVVGCTGFGAAEAAGRAKEFKLIDIYTAVLLFSVHSQFKEFLYTLLTVHITLIVC